MSVKILNSWDHYQIIRKVLKEKMFCYKFELAEVEWNSQEIRIIILIWDALLYVL